MLRRLLAPLHDKLRAIGHFFSHKERPRLENPDGDEDDSRAGGVVEGADVSAEASVVDRVP